MSVLFQEFRKYNSMTFLDNIGIGNAGETHDLDAVKEAAIKSGAHNHIRTLEPYYQTILYKEYHDNNDFKDDNLYYSGPQPLLFRNDPSKEPIFPFLIKVLCKKPHAQAAARGKRINWTLRPPPPKIPDMVPIPSHDPQEELRLINDGVVVKY